jgi:hypothetical protein
MKIDIATASSPDLGRTDFLHPAEVALEGPDAAR